MRVTYEAIHRYYDKLKDDARGGTSCTVMLMVANEVVIIYLLCFLAHGIFTCLSGGCHGINENFDTLPSLG